MAVETDIPLVDEILGESRAAIGAQYEAYRNHVYRMINFCFALRGCSEDEKERIVIAGCFHDIGIWTGPSYDYLPPSIAAARAYLDKAGRVQWGDEIAAMIDEHHKLRRYADDSYPLVEVFRRGDLVDFSLGLLKSGLPGGLVKDVKAAFRNAGFHQYIISLQVGWLPRHPLRPIPILKW